MTSEVANVKILRNFGKPHESGTYRRLVCMTGDNKGLTYYLQSRRVVLGRSDKADIKILDVKSSREHAELTFISGEYFLTDLGSQNGIIVNDLKVSQHQLILNDKIIVGQTVFKYDEVVITQEAALVSIEDDLDEYEVDDSEDDDKKTSSVDPAKKKKKLMIAAAVMVIVVLMLPSGDGKKRETKSVKTAFDTMRIEAPLVSDIEDKDVRDKLSAFIHRGQREYREENYFRAIDQFEMALILVPHHGQASFYLQKSQDSLRNYIKEMKEKAEQQTSSLRYQAAINQYCAIISFLQKYPEDERYIKAEKNIAILEEKIGLESGESKCY
jgi:pSer/pThr/pTyr-binding forkhead associated (FHA) protein